MQKENGENAIHLWFIWQVYDILTFIPTGFETFFDYNILLFLCPYTLAVLENSPVV